MGIVGGPLLIFGGPYSNYAATFAMKSKAEKLGIGAQNIICTGDMVAYCAEPVETLNLIRDWGIHVVMGNCEESLAQNELDCGCGFEEGSSCSTLAITWYDYANRLVTRDQREWMAQLPRRIEFEKSGRRFAVVHGSLDSINEFVFASSNHVEKRLAQMHKADIDVVLGGHCGIPFAQSLEDRLWLNAGVIGMPANDGRQNGWYLLIDESGGELSFSWHALDYDFESSYQSTHNAGMKEYAQALRDGMWPSTDVLPPQELNEGGNPIQLTTLKYASGPI
ncbi:MAG: metallophosphoesterase family protein [Pseudomonadota bacterium]